MPTAIGLQWFKISPAFFPSLPTLKAAIDLVSFSSPRYQKQKNCLIRFRTVKKLYIYTKSIRRGWHDGERKFFTNTKFYEFYEFWTELMSKTKTVIIFQFWGLFACPELHDWCPRFFDWHSKSLSYRLAAYISMP